MPDGVREDNFAGTDKDSKFVVALVHEWWSACCHLIKKNSQRPPVDSKVMTLHVEDFRRKVLRCATKRMGLLIWLQKLCQAEVRQAYIPVTVHQHILWFQVPVNDLIFVEVAQCKDDLSPDKLDGAFRKPFNFEDVIVDVSARIVVEEEVNPKLILENEVHRVDKRVRGLEQDFFFAADIFDLLLFDQDIFVNAFHRVQLAHLFVRHQEDLTE